MRWPLRNQILVPFAGVIVAALLVVSIVNAVLATRWTEEQIVGRLSEMAETLRPSSFPLTETVLKQARGLSGAELVVVGEDGRVQASSLVTPPQVDFGSDSEGVTRLGNIVELDGVRYFHNSVEPRRGPGTRAARIHILFPEGSWRESRRRAALPPLVIGGVALVGAVVVSIMLAHRLSRPLVQLRSQVGRIAEGDFQTLPLPARDDELRSLVASANTMAEKLRQLTEGLQRSERLVLLGQLSGGLAHHLRNDITGAKMAVQLHQRSCSGGDSQSLAVALRQLTLTEEHLQQCLAVGQPRPPSRVACDLRVVIEELVRLVEPTTQHRRISLQVAGEHTPLPLLADPDQIRQMLLNLVLNAIDAAGPSGWVRLEAVPDPTRQAVRVRVLDSGPGPPPAIRERLFEPFVTGKPEGVGLGLAAARQIAETHGGSIRLLSQPTTCFEIVLPSEGSQDFHDENAAPRPDR